MNITYRHFLLIFASLSLSACGQFGSLYVPGHGSGYYHDHPFTERPTTSVPEPTKTTVTKPKAATTSSPTSDNTNSTPSL